MGGPVLLALALMIITTVTAAGRTGPVTEPSAVDVARMKTIYLAQHLWRNVSNPHFTTMVRQDSFESTAQLINALESLSNAIKEMGATPVEDKLHNIHRWERIQAHSYGVGSLYATFVNFMKQQKETQQPSSRRAWLDIAETILQDIPTSENIHKLILAAVDKKEKNTTVYEIALKEHLTNICDNKQSTQLLLYNMYATLQLTQLKSYIMAQCAYALLQIYEKGDNEEKARLMTEGLKQRSKQQVDAVLHTMKEASRAMWRCDPRHYEEHVTYEQITRLLQGYIENEVDMNPTQTCRGSCKNYEFTESYGCYNDKFCNQQPKCEGRIIDCQFIESDMKVCQSNPREIRRYEYIEYKNNALLGTDRIAQSQDHCTLVTVNSWWRFFLPAHCSYCFCLCDEPSPLSDRFFSLSPEMADVSNNKVVTGLRFVKHNRVIYLQIQEGSLLPHGVVNASSLQWKPVNTTQSDYKMTWEKRSIDLDNLEAPEGHVLTGIRFQEVGTHLNMEIMATPIIYHKGVLKRPTELSYWIGNTNTDSALENPRSELKLPSANVPQNSNGPCKPDSQHDSFVQFTHSDIVTDAAQTTVPFLDIQPVVLNPPSLLGGAGLYHKGSGESAGFVAVKLMNYDISQHLTADELR